MSFLCGLEGSEKILRAQVDDYRCGYGLRLVIGTVDVQAACGEETGRVNMIRNHYQLMEGFFSESR